MRTLLATWRERADQYHVNAAVVDDMNGLAFASLIRDCADELERVLALLLVEARQVQDNKDVTTRVDTMGDSKDNPTASENETTPTTVTPNQVSHEACRAFRAGWASGYQEGAEGLEIDWRTETSERPSAETAALERWLFVEAVSAVRSCDDNGRTQPGADFADLRALRTVDGEARDPSSTCRVCGAESSAHCDLDEPGLDHAGDCDRMHHEFVPT